MIRERQGAAEEARPVRPSLISPAPKYAAMGQNAQRSATAGDAPVTNAGDQSSSSSSSRGVSRGITMPSRGSAEEAQAVERSSATFQRPHSTPETSAGGAQPSSSSTDDGPARPAPAGAQPSCSSADDGPARPAPAGGFGTGAAHSAASGASSAAATGPYAAGAVGAPYPASDSAGPPVAASGPASGAASSASSSAPAPKAAAPAAPAPAAPAMAAAAPAAAVASPGAQFVCGRPRPTNHRAFIDMCGAFAALDKGSFAMIKGWSRGGSNDIKVKSAQYGHDRELVAVKIINSNRLNAHRNRIHDDYEGFRRGDYSDIESALNEIGVYQQLNLCGQHSHIVRMLDVFSDAASLKTWLVLEYCQHGDLVDYVAVYGACHVNVLRRFARQMFQAVEHLHMHNVCHRDISMENWLLTGLDPVRTLKLMDFGQACLKRPGPLRALEDDGAEDDYWYFRMTNKDVYRAPEQWIPMTVRDLQVAVHPNQSAGQTLQLCQLKVFTPGTQGYMFSLVKFPQSAQVCGFSVGAPAPLQELVGFYMRGDDDIYAQPNGVRIERREAEQEWCWLDTSGECVLRAPEEAERHVPPCTGWRRPDGEVENVTAMKVFRAQLAGYQPAQSDVFSCGAVLLALHMGTFAWKNTTWIPGGGFRYMCENGLDVLTARLNKPFASPEALEFMKGLLLPTPSRRPTARQGLQNPFLQ